MRRTEQCFPQTTCGRIRRLIFSCFSGPPFTHQCTTDHMIYYGQSSCESDLERYLESLKSLWRRRSQSRETPIIINTMGWVKGQQWKTVKNFKFTLKILNIKFKLKTVSETGPHPCCSQDLDSSCLWTWFVSSQSHMSSSSVIVAPPSVPPSLQSFWGRHMAARRTHLLRPLWTSLQRATVPQEVTLTLLYSQSFKEWDAKEQRKWTTVGLQLQ